MHFFPWIPWKLFKLKWTIKEDKEELIKKEKCCHDLEKEMLYARKDEAQKRLLVQK